MIASKTATGQASPSVTIHCKVPGGPWFIGLSRTAGLEFELGPYENPAIAKADAGKLRQLLALTIVTHGATDLQGSEFSAAGTHQSQQCGIQNGKKDKS